MTTETTPQQMAPPIGIGGLLSVKSQSHFYRFLLHSPETSLSSHERFFPIPNKGLSPFPEMYGELEESITQAYDRLGSRLSVVGHSLGGLMAVKLGLEHPDKIRSVTALAGAQEGVKNMTPTGWLLKWSLGNPPGAEDIQHDSDFMLGLRHRVATEWSPDTSLHLISPTFDDLLPFPQGLGLELPAGQKVDRRIVMPPVPFAGGLLRRVSGLPDLRILPNPLITGHVDVPISPAVIIHSRQVRRVAAEIMNHIPFHHDSATHDMALAVA